MTDETEATWYELLRTLPAAPLTTDGDELDEQEMLAPGLEVTVVEERDGRLLLLGRGSTPSVEWRYLVDRAAFEEAITPPEDTPREGGVPTSSESGAPA